MDYNVDLAKMIQGCLDNRLTALGRCYRVIAGNCTATSVLNLFDDAICGCLRATSAIDGHAQVIDHHFGTFLGQEFADFPANTVPPTSDRRDFSCQNHCCSLL
jgi:hypothetical protein